MVANRVRPVKELKGFKKISLQPGEQQTIQFTLTTSQLSYYNEQGVLQIEPGQFKIFAGGNSRDLLETTITLVP
jgi:beta-glucosidase